MKTAEECKYLAIETRQSKMVHDGQTPLGSLLLMSRKSTREDEDCRRIQSPELDNQRWILRRQTPPSSLLLTSCSERARRWCIDVDY
nr:hypothetical protein Iba_chr12bCG26740 [Ipomoea batatas]